MSTKLNSGVVMCKTFIQKMVAVNHRVGSSSLSRGANLSRQRSNRRELVVSALRVAMERDVKELYKVLEELSEVGINLCRLSAHLGKPPNKLNDWKSRKTFNADPNEFKKAISYISSRLKKFDPDRHSIKYLCDVSWLKQSRLAEMIGVSRQAVDQFSSKVPEGRRAQLQREVFRIGNRLEKISFDI